MTQENKPAHKGLQWLKTLLGYGLFILVVSVALDAFRSREMPETLPLQTVQSLAGSQLDIAAMSMERPVILYYWASWCGVCPLVSGTVDGFSNSEQVVTVALQSGNNTQVKQYLQNKGYGFEVVNDPSGALARSLGVSATPTLLFIYQGEIRSSTTGVTSWPGIWLRLWLTKMNLI
ncbi:protein disulfide oxidoreductase [Shewanella chilikensis]|jgi:thiol-disulfide isomerase/thioredoxin|uniref:protein disulfide oxidoreductase n=1 Tax=Shewanella chilikensis TaxID=558541 RepID=UPI003B67DE70